MADHTLTGNGASFEQHSDHASQRLRSENRRLRNELEQLLQRCHAAESTIETLLGVLNTHGIDYVHLCEPILDTAVTHRNLNETLNRDDGHGSEAQSCLTAHDPMLGALNNGCLPSLTHGSLTQEDGGMNYDAIAPQTESPAGEAIISESSAESLPGCDIDGTNPWWRTVGSCSNLHSSTSRVGDRLEPEFHFDPAQPKLLQEPVYLPNLNEGFRTSYARGILDEYVLMLGRFLDHAAATTKLTSSLCQRLSSRGVQWVVREAWPEAEQFWKVTASMQGFHQAEMFRNFPSAKTYGALHPAYRPTKLQLSIPHAAIIDWLPWPDLRDQVILWQDDIDVDLVCRTAIENVVAHRKASVQKKSLSLQSSAEKRKPDTKAISFRVLDICLLEQQSQSGKPAAKTMELAYKPKSAAVCALEKAYGLEYDEFHTQRLHPRFFEQYPALYCQSAVSIFEVRDVAGVSASDFDVGRPRSMSRAATEKLARYFLDEIQCNNVNA